MNAEPGEARGPQADADQGARSPAPSSPASSPKNGPSSNAPRRRRPRRSAPAGTAPGSLLADPGALPSTVRVLAFGPNRAVEESPVSPARIAELRQAHAVVWLDVQGLADLELLKKLGEQFQLHRLALEDVVNVHQRAKFEDYEAHAFLVARVIDTAQDHETEQFAMFVGEGFVLTFLERACDCFALVRQRALEPDSQLRRRGSDYLAYALFDAVVDAYFPVLEQTSERLERSEDAILADSDAKALLAELHAVRRWLQVLRRALWPLRDASASLARGESPWFSAEVRPYLRDVHDHVVRLLDLLENQRELVGSLLELHLSIVNQRLNEVMKVLTIIATIFIPLTFVVGVYGMNFDWMPELRVWWGYPAAMLVMLAIVVLMLRWFRRRGWL